MANKIADVTRANEKARSKPLKVTILACIPDPNLQNIGMKQVCAVPEASLALAAYAEKDFCLRKFFNTLFRAGQTFVTLINWNRF